MKRGIKKQVAIQRTVTYSFTREDLLKRLKLPADAVLSFKVPYGDGTVDNNVRFEMPGGVQSLDVDVRESW